MKDEISEYVWNTLTPSPRGEFIEEVLANYDYADDYQIGREYKGYYPVIDFVSNEREVISLKTIDPRSYSSGASLSKLSEDLNTLASTPIFIDGVAVPIEKRRLDIRVPQGYRNSIDLKGLIKKAGEIEVTVEEF